VVTVTWQANSGTSNATTFTITGLPAEIQPTRAQGGSCTGVVENNTVFTTITSWTIAAGSGTLSFIANGSGSGFTALGTKGLEIPLSISYSLN
jgi:hypothetical protein